MQHSSVAVWRVVDTAVATFEVNDYVNFVRTQSESAVCNLAIRYSCGIQKERQLSLRGNTSEIADRLASKIQERLEKAGVDRIGTRVQFCTLIAAKICPDQSGPSLCYANQCLSVISIFHGLGNYGNTP